MLCRVYPMMLPFSVLYFDWSRHVVVLLVYVDFMIHNDFLYTVSSFSVNSTLSGILGQAVEGMYTYTYNLQFRIQIWGLYLGTLSSQTPIYGIHIHIRKWFWIKSAFEEAPQLVLPCFFYIYSIGSSTGSSEVSSSEASSTSDSSSGDTSFGRSPPL